MHFSKKLWFVFVWLPILGGMQGCSPSGTYRIQTFSFVPSDPDGNDSEPSPSVWIDTNIKMSGLFGGTVTSSLPCSVMIDFTDSSFSFEAAEFNRLKITYDDGSVDSSIETLKLPVRIAAREYETVNSVSGGRVVKSKVWIISGAIPGVITRDEPFRLELEGQFITDEGKRLPFVIDQHFDIERENDVKSAKDLLRDM